MSDFTEICNKMVPRILNVTICSLRGEGVGDENKRMLTLYPWKEPSNYECAEIEQIRDTGTIIVMWGENRLLKHGQIRPCSFQESSLLP